MDLLSIDGIRPNKSFILCSVIYDHMTSDINTHVTCYEYVEHITELGVFYGQ